LDEFKTKLNIDARIAAFEGRIDPLIERLQEIAEKTAALETFKEGITVLIERVNQVENFSKAFGEDFDFAKFEDRLAAIEETPYVKGIAGAPPAADAHEKIWGSDNPLAEVERMRRGQ